MCDLDLCSLVSGESALLIRLHAKFWQKPFDVSIAIEPSLTGFDEDRASLLRFLEQKEQFIGVTVKHVPRVATGPLHCLCFARNIEICREEMFEKVTKLGDEALERAVQCNGSSNEFIEIGVSNDWRQHMESWTIDHAFLDQDSIIFGIRPGKSDETPGEAFIPKCRRCGLPVSRSIHGTTLKVARSSRLGVLLLTARAAPKDKPLRLRAGYMHGAISDWTSLSTDNPFTEYGVFAMVLLSAVYGGVHLAAWNANFSSAIESVLWRSSGILTAGGPLLFAVVFVLCTSLGDTDTWAHMSGWIQKTAEVSSYIAFIGLAIAYTFARVYLVVESFIQLRSVPIGVYIAVSTLVPASIQLHILTTSRYHGRIISHTSNAPSEHLWQSVERRVTKQTASQH